MKVNVEINDGVEEPVIHITCKRVDEKIGRILSLIEVLDLKLTGKKDGQTYFLDTEEIFYVEVVDKHTFFYTEKAFYDTSYKLYELEELLQPYDFFRISKSCIVNLKVIRSLKNDIDGKITAWLKNNERLVISRQYALQIKRKLGVVK